MTQKLPQQDMIVTTSSQMMVMMSSLLNFFKMLKLTIMFKMITGTLVEQEFVQQLALVLMEPRSQSRTVKSIFLPIKT